MTTIVRPAAPDDAPRLARIRIDSWRATYAGIVPAHLLERLDADRNEAFFMGRTADRPGATLVAVNESGTTVGYALTGPSRDDDAPGLGEVEAIYLDPDARGLGHGRALLLAAQARLRASGFDAAILWVLTDNEPARRFYERAGFALDGAARWLDFDGTQIEEIRYRRTIPTASTIPA